MNYREKFENRMKQLLSRRFDLLKELGIGGMGKVFKAYDKEESRFVALKIIKPEHLYREDIFLRFRNEMELASKIDNRHVVKTYSYYWVEDIHCILMDFVEGETLDFILGAGLLSFNEIIRVGAEILEGIEAAHKVGIIHRDLKPQNIILNPEGSVVITDFGLARELDATRFTKTAGLMGTPQYIAPEQWVGEKPDTRSDIYSFGIILYEMVYGELPFKSFKDYGYMDLHLKSPIRLPAKNLRKKVPSFLKAIILKCLEKRSEKRYQKVEDILKDLKGEKVTGSLKVLIKNRFINISKTAFLIVSLLIVAVGSGILFNFYNSGGEKITSPVPAKPLTLGVLLFKDRTHNRSFTLFEKAVPFLLTEDLSQSKHLYVARANHVFHNIKDAGFLKKDILKPSDLKLLSRLIGINYLIQGSLDRVDNQIVVRMTLNDGETGGGLFECSVAIDNKDKLFEVIDKFTWRIKKVFLDSHKLEKDIDRNIKDISTGNIAALSYFMEGIQAYYNGDNSKADMFFKEATAQDSNFALAFRYMFLVNVLENERNYSYWIYTVLKNKRNKLSQLRWLNVLSEKARLVDNKELAIKKQEEVCRNFPYDIDAKIALGVLYRDQWYFDKAGEVLEDSVNQVFNATPIKLLLELYLMDGNYRECRTLLKRAEKYFSKTLWLKHYKWLFNVCIRDLEEADKVSIRSPVNRVEKSLNSILKKDLNGALEMVSSLKDKLVFYSNEVALIHSVIYLYQGQLNKACKSLDNRLFFQYRRPSGKIFLGIRKVYIQSRFDLKKSMTLLEQLIDNSEYENGYYMKEDLLFLKGVLKLNSSLKLTEDELGEFEYFINMRSCNRARFLYTYLQKVEARDSEALEELCNRYPKEHSYYNLQGLLLDQLLRVYLFKGDEDGILKTCKRIQNLTIGRFLYGDVYALSFYHQGKVYLKNRQLQKAEEAFKTFLKLFKDGDKKSFPQIEEAQWIFDSLSQFF